MITNHPLAGGCGGVTSRRKSVTAHAPAWCILSQQCGSAAEGFRRVPMIPHMLIIDGDLNAAQTTCALVAHITTDATLAVESTPACGRASLQRHLADVLIIDPSPHDL